MRRRAAAVAETRRRIVAATKAVHDEQGVLATTLEDIARRADVSVGTVYRHFPTLEDLLRECGAHVMEILRPPASEDAGAIFQDARTLPERIQRLVVEAFALYERGAATIEVIRRERDYFHPLERAYERIEASLDALVREALAPFAPDARSLAVARALIDVRVWQALGEQGLSGEAAAEVVGELLLCRLNQSLGAARSGS